MSPQGGSCQKVRNYVYICWSYAEKKLWPLFSGHGTSPPNMFVWLHCPVTSWSRLYSCSLLYTVLKKLPFNLVIMINFLSKFRKKIFFLKESDDDYLCTSNKQALLLSAGYCYDMMYTLLQAMRDSCGRFYGNEFYMMWGLWATFQSSAVICVISLTNRNRVEIEDFS